jgi:hypothetical protein
MEAENAYLNTLNPIKDYFQACSIYNSYALINPEVQAFDVFTGKAKYFGQWFDPCRSTFRIIFFIMIAIGGAIPNQIDA